MLESFLPIYKRVTPGVALQPILELRSTRCCMACLVDFYKAGYHFQLASFLSTGFQLASCAHQMSTLKLYRHTSVTIIKFILNSVISLLWQPTCTRCIAILKCEHGCMIKENYEALQSQH